MPKAAVLEKTEVVEPKTYQFQVDKKDVRDYPLNILKVWVKRYITTEFVTAVNGTEYVFVTYNPHDDAQISLMMEQVGQVGYPLRSTWAIDQHWKKYEVSCD